VKSEAWEVSLKARRFKVSKLYLPNKGSLAGCKPPIKLEPKTQFARADSQFPIAGAPQSVQVSRAA